VYDNTLCTHYVTRKFARTLNSLMAVARGQPVVTPAWVEGSGREGEFLDPSPFVVQDRRRRRFWGLASSTPWGSGEGARCSR